MERNKSMGPYIVIVSGNGDIGYKFPVVILKETTIIKWNNLISAH